MNKKKEVTHFSFLDNSGFKLPDDMCEPLTCLSDPAAADRRKALEAYSYSEKNQGSSSNSAIDSVKVAS